MAHPLRLSRLRRESSTVSSIRLEPFASEIKAELLMAEGRPRGSSEREGKASLSPFGGREEKNSPSPNLAEVRINGFPTKPVNRIDEAKQMNDLNHPKHFNQTNPKERSSSGRSHRASLDIPWKSALCTWLKLPPYGEHESLEACSYSMDAL